MPIDHTSVLKTIELRWGLPALTARDAAAPDLGGVLTLTTPRTDDPLAGVVAPTSTGANPAADEVSHLQQLQAQMISDLPVPSTSCTARRCWPTSGHPADYDNYIAPAHRYLEGDAGGALTAGSPRARLAQADCVPAGGARAFPRV